MSDVDWRLAARQRLLIATALITETMTIGLLVVVFYRASSYTSAQRCVGSRYFICLSVRTSVRLSVTCCDKTKQCIADILIPHERAISLVF